MPREDALETYARRRGDIARLLDVLQMELDAHAAKANADRHPWQLAGDLQKAREDLIGLVGFLAGMDRERVEDFLADAGAARPSLPPSLECPACGRRIDIVKVP